MQPGITICNNDPASDEALSAAVEMISQILTISKFTIIESMRNRLLWLSVLVVAISFGLVEFIGDLAITEQRATQVAVLASFLRLSCCRHHRSVRGFQYLARVAGQNAGNDTCHADSSQRLLYGQTHGFYPGCALFVA